MKKQIRGGKSSPTGKQISLKQKLQNNIEHLRADPPFAGLQTFLLLWSTQALSGLGSAMTSFALIIWAYEQDGSAMTTALLSVCSYAPYVVLSIFAGALSDRWNKKRTMLVCDTCAAVCTLIVVILLWNGWLQVWHLYLLNSVNGLMNAFQFPASEVAVSLIVPKEKYHRIGGLQSFSNSLVTILTPMLASAVLAFGGMTTVILFDLVTFLVAFAVLATLIRIPSSLLENATAAKESVLKGVRDGLHWLREHRGGARPDPFHGGHQSDCLHL